jgi:hypothetical protein
MNICEIIEINDHDDNIINNNNNNVNNNNNNNNTDNDLIIDHINTSTETDTLSDNNDKNSKF